MEVILLERVPNLGQMGDVVTVKPGFARNFLLPKKKALRATRDSIALFEKQKAQLEATNLKKKTEAEEVASKLQGITLTLIRQAGDNGHLYGSVTTRDITDALIKNGVEAFRSQIILEAPIKEIGIYTSEFVLHPEVVLPVTLVIAQSEDEAKARLLESQKTDILDIKKSSPKKSSSKKDRGKEDLNTEDIEAKGSEA